MLDKWGVEANLDKSKIRLSHINICQDCTLPVREEPNWFFELFDENGSTWRIEEGLTEIQAIDRAQSFRDFSGLPLYHLGQEW